MPLLAAGQTVILREPADHTAAILTFIGAIAVALIAAVTAHLRLIRRLSSEGERLDRQLSSENERLADQLNEERGRLDRRLNHDRQMSDTADLRLVLQRILDIYEARRVLIEEMHLKHKGDRTGTSSIEELKRRMDTTFTEQQNAITSLRIRLGLDDPLDQAVTTAGDALLNLASSIGKQREYDVATAERAAPPLAGGPPHSLAQCCSCERVQSKRGQRHAFRTHHGSCRAPSRGAPSGG